MIPVVLFLKSWNSLAEMLISFVQSDPRNVYCFYVPFQGSKFKRKFRHALRLPIGP